MTITLRPYQQKVIDDLTAALRKGYRKPLIVCATGGGKCFAKGTKIVKYDGSIINVEDLKVGDVIMGYDSKPRTIKSICSGYEQMYDIIPVKGEKYTVNESHILSLKISGNRAVYCGKKRFEPNSVANVTIKEYLSSNNNFKHVAKGWRNGVEFEDKNVPIPPYLLGLWLGDGDRYDPAITTIDHEIIEYIYSYAKSINCFVRKDDITYNISRGRNNKIKNKFRESLKDLKLIDNKHIPHIYLCNSRKKRLELLAGLIDTDGSLGHQYDYITKSRTLADDVLYLCRSLGLAAYLSEQHKSCTYKGNKKTGIYYRISISGDIHNIPCKIERKKALPRRQKKDVLRVGLTIKDIGYGQYFGFELKEDNRLFLLADFTVVHNTAIATKIAEGIKNKGNSLIFMCHRTELVDQTYRTFLKNDIEPDFIAAGRKFNPNSDCHIAMVNTLLRRLQKVDCPNVLICDESHHLASKTWKTVSDYYNKSITIGLTATPCRLDGKPLSDMFDCMIIGPQTDELIREGYLVPYKYYAPTNLDTSKIKVVNGEYQAQALDEFMRESSVIGDNIEQYKKLAMGKRNVVFACNVKHSMEIVRRYNEAGIPAAHLDGNTNTGERKQIIKDFESGKVKVLSNVDLFGEGFDLPAIEVVSMLRPTMSLSLCIQQWGRGLRTAPEIGKTECLILDHVNNYQRHGLPDEHREWSLDGGIKRKKRGQSSDIKIKRCPNCFFAHPPALKCPNCGYEYTSDGKTIKEVAGELYLIDSEEYKQAKKREVIEVSSYEELVKLEHDRGYKVGWAENRWKAKTGEDLTASFAGYERIAAVRGYSNGWAWFRWKNKRSKNK